MNAAIIDEFRSNEGRVGGPFEGMPMLLLHTVGAKSREPRINPVARLDHDGRTFVFATNGGRDVHPGWYYNVLANPQVFVEVGTTSYAAKSVALAEPDRSEIYAEQVRRNPAFQDYADRVARTIPVVELIR
jgi:deazaflavin-dependent oxidoreductase (nitroreductase family)